MPKVEISVEIRYPNADSGEMSHGQFKLIEDAIKEVFPRAFPEDDLRALWVHFVDGPRTKGPTYA